MKSNQNALNAPQMTWTTYDGRELTFALELEEMVFLERVRKAVLDENTSSADVLNLVFAHDNPFTVPDEAGAARLSSDVMESPAGAMLRDLMFRKQLAEVGMEAEQVLAARFSIPTAEAAERAGVTVQAIVQAIKSELLAGSKIGGRWMVTPASLEAYIAVRGGPAKTKGDLVAVRMGNKPGVSVRIKHDGIFEKLDKTEAVLTGTLEDWTELAVITSLKAKNGGKDSQRFYRLVPGDTVNQVELEGFWVRGAFEFEEVIHDPAEARDAFKNIR